jgi:alpha-L-rhamnosidase
MAGADLQTYYGNISSHWKTENNNLMLDVEVPGNTTATVYLPATSADNITESGKLLSSETMIKISVRDERYIELQIGSGVYHFVVKK